MQNPLIQGIETALHAKRRAARPIPPDAAIPTPNEPQDVLRQVAEEQNPQLREIRVRIREPRVVALRCKTGLLAGGHRYAAGEEICIVNPQKLPRGVVSELEATRLIESGAVEGISETELEVTE